MKLQTDYQYFDNLSERYFVWVKIVYKCQNYILLMYINYCKSIIYHNLYYIFIYIYGSKTDKFSHFYQIKF